MGIGSGGVNMTGCICARPPFPGCVLVAGCNKKDDKKDDIHITVSGGEFYKFNPAAAPENLVENWVADGSVNFDYCRYCYGGGRFLQECTMNEMIDHCSGFVDEVNRHMPKPMTMEEYKQMMQGFFPMLKRWRK